MAPANGANNKPANAGGRRAASKVVIPALPLNYPQRPTTRPAAAVPKSPKAVPQPLRHTAENREEQQQAGGSDPRIQNDSASEDVKMPETAPSGDNKAEASQISVDQTTPATAGSTVTIAPSAVASLGTPTVVAATTRYSVASPKPSRPVGPIMPSSNGSSPYGHEAPVPNPQPSMAFRPPFHQAHPSNGSMMFGGFQDSNASSPAPHSGSGFLPPEMLPYPPIAPVDAYGRPLLVSPTLDGYPPALLNHHGPPTPHSFQGSQSSAPADEHGLTRYPAVNGTNGHLTDPTLRMPVPLVNGHTSGSMHTSPGSVSMLQNLRQQDDTIAFLRSGTEDGTFNDCILEMHFPDVIRYQPHPDFRRLRSVVRMPAHRFILSRSRTLAGILKAQRTAPGGLVHLELRGEYMRSDVFCYALNTLYGWSIGDGMFPTDLRLRDVRDDFNLALCYITVSQYLQLSWIHPFAIRRASQLLCWETLELAINYVLPPIVASSRARNEPFHNMELLGHILGFIVKNFPKDFCLDTNVTTGDLGFARLPAVLISQPPSAPTIADGSSSGVHSRQSSKTQEHLSRGQRLSTNPRLSQIKFGDISPDRTGPSSAENSKVAQRRTASPNETILSRVLLNLPYELLKQVVEDPNLAGAPGELDPARRSSIVNEIVAEREARRLRTLDKSQTQLHVLQETLEKSAAPLVVEQMGDFLVNNMGFKEEVCPGDIPFLVHTWTQSPSNSASVSV